MMLHLSRALIGLVVAALAQTATAASSIHVRQTGSGENCWVLLHPFTASGKFWDSRAQKIADARQVRVYSPDLPNHGASALVEQFDYGAAATAIQQALASSCPHPQMIVVGASSGGIVAMKLGAATQSKVAAIGVGDAFTAANLADMGKFGALPLAERERQLGGSTEQGAAQIAALTQSYADLAASGTGQFLTPAERRALEGRLLMLWGDKDSFFLRPSVDALVRSVERTQFRAFEGAPHLGPLAKPWADETWPLIDSFARETAVRPERG